MAWRSTAGELPDFLPLFLEFLSLLPDAEAQALLAEPAGILRALADRLRTRASPATRRFLRRSPRLRERAGRVGTARHPERRPRRPRGARRGLGGGGGPLRPGRAVRRLRHRPAATAPCAPAQPATPPQREETERCALISTTSLYGWYPYVALTVFLLGSLLRFDHSQYTWRTGSSQLLRRRQLMWGSNLFHVGILVIFGGHFVGLLTPVGVFDALGISHTFKQLLAMSVGGIAGVACWVGIALLAHRRLFDARIRNTSSFGDIAILLML